MSDADSGSAVLAFWNPPPEASRIPPTGAQPPPYDYELRFPSLESTASSPKLCSDIPPSDVRPDIRASDGPSTVAASEGPSEVPQSSTPEIPSHVPPQMLRPDVFPLSFPADVPPPIPPSGISPPISLSRVSREILPPDLPRETHICATGNGFPRSASSSTDVSTSASPSESHAQFKRPPRSYQTSSFSHPSSLKPEHKQLKYTYSSPAIPYEADDDGEDFNSPGKYSPRTRSPSDGSDVRWYFCKTPLRHDEAAASVPSTEVVGKGEYFRFSKGDSDALEAAFLEREEELVRAWWKEYGESREGPSASSSHNAYAGEAGHISPSDRNEFDSSRRFQLNAWDEEENVGVLVKGGLYEVDLVSRRCLPVYWRGDHRRVLRGHWFARKGGLDWLPLREDLSEQLEIAYESQIWRRRRFQPSGLYAARVNLHGATLGLHALFTGEDDSWEAWLCVDTTGISFVLGLRGSGVKLRRGFALPEAPQPTQDEVRQHKEEEMDDYASKVPVRHVVFMVHGIGQRLEKANLVDDVGAFRRSVAMLAEQHLTHYQRFSQRVLFIPCQWRRELKLGGESSVEDCTLEGVRALRKMLSATVHDVLYYMSPVYCQDIIDSVSRSLNRLYRKFIKRNPHYDGKVSIYGHSLGTVLSYDILCHQTDESSTSTAPIAEVRSDEYCADEPSNSVSPESEIKLDVNETCEEVLPSNTSDGENGLSIPANSVDTTAGDIYYEKLAEAEKNKEIKGRYKNPQMECNGDSHEPEASKRRAEVPQVQATEVEALKAEVKLLQEKLSALMQAGSLQENSGSSLLTADSSTLPHATFGMLGDDNSNGTTRHGTGLVISQATKDPKYTGVQLDSRFSSNKHFTPYISYTKLDFKVDTFYAVGSPLGVFLSLRNIRIGEGLGQEYWQDNGIEEEMPAVRQMMNIFHPYDPVAYRIEPLICKEFVKRRPKFIPYHKGGKRLHIGIQEFQENWTARSKAFVNSLNSTRTRVAHALFALPLHETEETEVTREKTYGAKMMERLTGGPEGRVDYQLQDSTFEHPYIAVLSSHTAYWHDLDTALFILKHLYKDIPEEPPAAPENHYKSIETGLDAIVEDFEVSDFSNPDQAPEMIRFQENSDLEELPLTFASKVAIAAVLADARKVKPDWMK